MQQDRADRGRIVTARPIQPGDRGVDYSGYRPKRMFDVYRAGARFVIRYSAGVGNSDARAQWKLCGKNEILDATLAGLDFIANSEWYESRITEGIAAGRADGAADLLFWQSRGLARGATVYVSWDQDPARSKWDAAVGYLAGYGQALRGYYRPGCYAGSQFLRYAISKGVITQGWRPNAGSWSGDSLPYQPSNPATLVAEARQHTLASIWQTGNYWFGKNADENVILRTPVGSHLEALTGATGEFTMDAEAKAAFAALNKRLDALPNDVWTKPRFVDPTDTNPDPTQRRTYAPSTWLVYGNRFAASALDAAKAMTQNVTFDAAAAAAELKQRFLNLIGGS